MQEVGDSAVIVPSRHATLVTPAWHVTRHASHVSVADDVVIEEYLTDILSVYKSQRRVDICSEAADTVLRGRRERGPGGTL